MVDKSYKKGYYYGILVGTLTVNLFMLLFVLIVARYKDSSFGLIGIITVMLVTSFASLYSYLKEEKN